MENEYTNASGLTISAKSLDAMMDSSGGVRIKYQKTNGKIY